MSKDIVSPIIGSILIGFSIFLFLWSVLLMIMRDIPSSLLAALIGFVTLTGGITVIRTWSLARVVYRSEEKQGERREQSKTS